MLSAEKKIHLKDAPRILQWGFGSCGIQADTYIVDEDIHPAELPDGGIDQAIACFRAGDIAVDYGHTVTVPVSVGGKSQGDNMCPRL
jgi:hypothetical protein